MKKRKKERGFGGVLDRRYGSLWTVGMSHGLARLPRADVGPKDRYAASRTTGAP